MIIKLGGRPISSNKMRAIGFQVIDVASSIDRYHAQVAQARTNPDSLKEREQAYRAEARARGSMERLREMIAEAKGDA